MDIVIDCHSRYDDFSFWERKKKHFRIINQTHETSTLKLELQVRELKGVLSPNSIFFNKLRVLIFEISNYAF